MNNSPIRTTEDIRKLHEEGKQLRNQQFLLGTVALTVVGFSSWMFPSLAGGTKPSLGYASATVALQILLAVLFIWSVALRRLIGIISAYLKIKKASDWESDFYEFSNDPNSGYWRQSLFVKRLYQLLGVLVGVSFVLVMVANGQPLSTWPKLGMTWPVWSVVISTGAYLIIVRQLGQKASNYDREVEAKWRELMPDRNNTPSYSTEPSHAPEPAVVTVPSGESSPPAR